MNGGNMNTSSVGEQFTEIYLKKDSNVQVGFPEIFYSTFRRNYFLLAEGLLCSPLPWPSGLLSILVHGFTFRRLAVSGDWAKAIIS